MSRLVAIFVRHGSTVLNDENRFRGAVDVDLDDKGRKQAEEVRDLLKFRPLGSAFTTSKKRTKETADIVLAGRNQGHREIKNLDALNVGEFTGQLKTKDAENTLKYYQDNPDAKIPGGERINDFRARVNPEIQKVVQHGEESGVPAIAFVHSSIIHQIGQLYHGDHNFVKVTPGGVVGVYNTPNGYEARALFKESKPGQDDHLAS